MASTIQDIAKRAGVSPGTVSRILNGKNKENRPTMIERAARVRELAAELGYRPNAAARSILSGRFGLVAFVTCGDWGIDWFPRSLLHGIHQALEERQMRLVITEVKASRLIEAAYVPNLLREAAVDGLVVHLDPRFGPSVIPYFESLKLPLVWVNHQAPKRSVYPDDHAAGKRLASDLIKAGHKKIAYLRYGMPVVPHYSVIARRGGYMEALAEAGLKPRVCEYEYTSHDVTGGMIMARRFLSECADHTAVICYEINEAITLYAALKEAGRKDLDIVLFHERELRSHSAIELPTMVIPFYDVGYKAAQMVLKIIDGKAKDPASVCVPFGDVLL